ncbi:serine/threonine-protein phosphatase PGAM5, mitochondrial-like isoform X2 [Bacillus rossius redtenbacheri]|uniref:serine/threonine-protein phosphatase PGAM5, mitochondrial-like isoform X2 n=1 Tax=Bacillus rossius redtenbacheri TaxID=93214 RepID=UPI002FDCF671
MRRILSFRNVVGVSGVCLGSVIWHIGKNSKDTDNLVSNDKWDHNWDRRDPKYLTKPSKQSQNVPDSQEGGDSLVSVSSVKDYRPVAKRNILLIRHGQYNQDGMTDKERTLTHLGRKQSELTGRRLRELAYPYTILYRSTMTRARETAEIIERSLPALPVEDSSLLEEGVPFPPEPPSSNWKPELYYFQDGARIEAAFRKYFHRAKPSQKEDSYEIFVCHANVIRYFVCRALQLPPEAWLRMSLHHASITWLTLYPNGRVALRCYSDAGHMPPCVMSSSGQSTSNMSEIENMIRASASG